MCALLHRVTPCRHGCKLARRDKFVRLQSAALDLVQDCFDLANKVTSDLFSTERRPYFTQDACGPRQANNCACDAFSPSTGNTYHMLRCYSMHIQRARSTSHDGDRSRCGKSSRLIATVKLGCF